MTTKTGRHSLPAMLFALLVPAILTATLAVPKSREVFLALTDTSPYIMGFMKFALLATTGEILAIGISSGALAFPKAAPAKAAIWGLIGMMITLLMPLYFQGVTSVQSAGLLPGAQSAFLTALFTSTIINLTFGIAMMAFHRITDCVAEHWREAKRPILKSAVRSIDWVVFVRFVVLRTIPFFWIPAHTVTFLLPPQYRVFLSAVLSIVLGMLLAIAKKKGTSKA